MENISLPKMHCHDELEQDLKYPDFIPDQLLMRWLNDGYSTSAHLLTLYSIARGLKAKNILEIGFGRSSFVLARAAAENGGRFLACDERDFSYLLNAKEKQTTEFVLGQSDKVWPILEKGSGVDLAFLDYFSSEAVHAGFIIRELKHLDRFMKTNGMIIVHDSIVDIYNVGKAIKRFAFWNRYEFVSLPYCYGLGVLRKLGRSQYGVIHDQFKKKA